MQYVLQKSALGKGGGPGDLHWTLLHYYLFIISIWHAKVLTLLTSTMALIPGSIESAGRLGEGRAGCSTHLWQNLPAAAGAAGAQGERRLPGGVLFFAVTNLPTV